MATPSLAFSLALNIGSETPGPSGKFDTQGPLPQRMEIRCVTQEAPGVCPSRFNVTVKSSVCTQTEL